MEDLLIKIFCDTDDFCIRLDNYLKHHLDKGYLSQPLFKKLYDRGIKLITKIKKNMKNKLIDIEEKLLLRKRALIETINLFAEQTKLKV